MVSHSGCTTGGFIQVESYNICPFVSGFFHLASCFQGSSWGSMRPNFIDFMAA